MKSEIDYLNNRFSRFAETTGIPIRLVYRVKEKYYTVFYNGTKFKQGIFLLIDFNKSKYIEGNLSAEELFIGLLLNIIAYLNIKIKK